MESSQDNFRVTSDYPALNMTKSQNLLMKDDTKSEATALAACVTFPSDEPVRMVAPPKPRKQSPLPVVFKETLNLMPEKQRSQIEFINEVYKKIVANKSDKRQELKQEQKSL